MKKRELLDMIEYLSLDGEVVFEVENLRFHCTDYSYEAIVSGKTADELTLKVFI